MTSKLKWVGPNLPPRPPRPGSARAEAFAIYEGLKATPWEWTIVRAFDDPNSAHGWRQRAMDRTPRDLVFAVRGVTVYARVEPIEDSESESGESGS